jgi:hypothetical protein
MRYIEIALLLIPVGLIAAWLYGIRGLSPRGLAASAALLVAMAGGLYWFGSDRAVSGRYVPAHVQDGRIVPGHGQ